VTFKDLELWRGTIIELEPLDYFCYLVNMLNTLHIIVLPSSEKRNAQENSEVESILKSLADKTLRVYYRVGDFEPTVVPK
jgi:hypothetical protein